MKRVNKSIVYIGLFGVLLFAFSSCEDYLDREPNTTVSSKEAFKNFDNFQGFIEEVISAIPDKEKCSWCPSWNWGDDEVFNPQGDDRLTHQIDLGNYRKWYQPTSDLGNWLLVTNSQPNTTEPKQRSLWGNAWYCIRKMNMGLEHIDDMTIGTDEEKRRLMGQCYFYRAWWHFELIEWFGGLPYVDAVLDPNDIPQLPRLTFQECAARCAEDFKKAAELLPICWDSTEVKGQDEKNQLRANKIVALCYKGKAELWAASPLMEHGAQLGALSSGKTYEYNQDLCKAAAETFGEALNLIETKANKQYQLANFDYKDIYNHTKDPSNVTPGYDPVWCFSDLFYTYNQKLKNPGGNEAIFRTPSSSGGNCSNWATTKVFGPKVAGLVAHDKIIHQPTANLVEMYGMANGLPIKDENGNYANGFDPTHPWKDRDPRFYHDIIFDGFKFLNGATSDKEAYRYCELFTGGNMRPVADGSQTGYFIQKLVPHQCNEVDKWYQDGWGDGMHVVLNYMRLADVYLMYAEACAAIGGATYKADSYDKTAVDAVNVVRARCHAGPVGGTGSLANSKYVTDPKLFMDEIRRERAVELSFEGFRFNDLQRWLLLTEYPYNTKFAVEFTRGESDEFYQFKNGEDPKDAKVNNYKLRPIISRNFGTKHYWFPFPDQDVYLYEGFAQNPGW